MKLRYSILTLTLASAIVMALGVYFAVFRPTLLPEDLRYLDRSRAELDTLVPSLGTWLAHVFWVMGGYMFATGLAMFYLAVTSFRTRARGAVAIAAIAGAASIGGMAVVNVLIDSDYKWPLALLAALWALAFAFYRLEGAAPQAQTPRTSASSREAPAGRATQHT